MRLQSGSALAGTVGSFESVAAGTTVNRLPSHLVYIVAIRRTLALVITNRFLNFNFTKKKLVSKKPNEIVRFKYDCVGREDPAGILTVAMAAAIIFTLANTVITAGRVDASSPDAGIGVPAFINVDFAQVTFVASRRAIAGEIVDTVDTATTIETRTLSAFINIEFAMVARESFVALANVSLKSN